MQPEAAKAAAVSGPPQYPAPAPSGEEAAQGVNGGGVCRVDSAQQQQQRSSNSKQTTTTPPDAGANLIRWLAV